MAREKIETHRKIIPDFFFFPKARATQRPGLSPVVILGVGRLEGWQAENSEITRAARTMLNINTYNKYISQLVKWEEL